MVPLVPLSVERDMHPPLTSIMYPDKHVRHEVAVQEIQTEKAQVRHIPERSI